MSEKQLSLKAAEKISGIDERYQYMDSGSPSIKKKKKKVTKEKRKKEKKMKCVSGLIKMQNTKNAEIFNTDKRRQKALLNYTKELKL